MANYRNQRNYENLNIRIFPGEGRFGIPALFPIPHIPEGLAWIGFNYAKGCEEPAGHGVHFFVDDYQFLRVWSQPERYVRMLSRFGAVTSPDFSLYTNFPQAVSIYNHYRKHWFGRYCQIHRITVIPTICWGGPDTWDWCFDGEPGEAPIAVSAVGTQADSGTRELFSEGFRACMDTLQPTEILFYGDIPDDVQMAIPSAVRIVPVRAFQARFSAEGGD